jgi:hypothetical protein
MKYLFALILCVASFPSWGATCWVAEYDRMVRDANGNDVPVAMEPALAVQAVTSVDSTTQSAALNALTRFVIILCDAQVYFSFGVNPTATTSTFYLPATTETARGVARATGNDATLKIAFCDNDCA